MPLPSRAGTATALRSAGVGAAATLLDLALLATLTGLLQVDPRIASPIGLLAGVSVQFLGNKVFAFRDRSTRWGPQIAAFAAVEAGALALNALGFDLLVTRSAAPPVLARLLVSASVYFLFCLPLWSRVFRGRDAAVQASAG